MNHREGQGRPPEGKKAEILRIAAEEFSLRGYSGASTNTITKRAGISKGILFHYFGSKKELFLMLLRDAAKRLEACSEAGAEHAAGASLYDTMAALFLSNTAYFDAYPLDMGLLERAQLEQDAEVRREIAAILTGLGAAMRQRRLDIARGVIGRSILRAGITPEQALDCVLLSLEALDMHFYALYRGRGAEVISNPAPMLDKMKLFLDVVARGLFEQ